MSVLLSTALVSFGLLLLCGVLVPLIVAARMDGRASAGVA